MTRTKPLGPIKSQSQNPVLLGFLAMPLESPQTLAPNRYDVSFQTTFSNIFEYDQTGQTQTYLDMEIWRLALNFGYGLTKSLDVNITLPLISQSGGFLDGFIQGYHKAFGFPNGGRDRVNNGGFQYRIEQNGTTLMNLSQTGFALSDLSVRLKWLISKHIKIPFKLSLASYVKLPTGKSSSGLSSGNADAGLSLFGEKSLGRFHFVSQIGLGLLGAHEQLSSIQKRTGFYFGQSIEWAASNKTSLVAQVTGQTAPFENVDTTDLSQINLDLNLGVVGTYPLKGYFKEWYYQFSFAEDVLSTGPSVDFSIYLMSGVHF